MEDGEDREVIGEETVQEQQTIPEQTALEQVRVVCAGCRQEYTFDIRTTVTRFACVCPNCGTKSTWNRHGKDE